MSEKIHQGHRKRARDSALKNGMKHCAEHELLEMLLYYSLPRIDTNPIAHALIERFGSIKGVLDAKAGELKAVEGIGDSSAHLIRVMSEILCRYLTDDPEKRYRFDDIGKVTEFLYPKFVGINIECLYILLFNNRLNLLACEKLSEGVINCSDVMTRRIAELVVNTGAAAALLAHNHPNGMAIPSSADLETTDVLHGYFNNMNVTMLDHLIFADQRYTSVMRERYGKFRISPVTQIYDEAFYESFYSKGDGNVHPSLPGGDGGNFESPVQD